MSEVVLIPVNVRFVDGGAGYNNISGDRSEGNGRDTDHIMTWEILSVLVIKLNFKSVLYERVVETVLEKQQQKNYKLSE